MDFFCYITISEHENKWKRSDKNNMTALISYGVGSPTSSQISSSSSKGILFKKREKKVCVFKCEIIIIIVIYLFFYNSSLSSIAVKHLSRILSVEREGKSFKLIREGRKALMSLQ